MEKLKEGTLYILTYPDDNWRIMECLHHIEGTTYKFFVQDSGMVPFELYGYEANIRIIDISELKKIEER